MTLPFIDSLLLICLLNCACSISIIVAVCLLCCVVDGKMYCQEEYSKFSNILVFTYLPHRFGMYYLYIHIF